MSSPAFGSVEISHPILQSATSARVSPSLNQRSSANLSKPQQQPELVALDRLQTKYASPENLLPAGNTKLSTASTDDDMPAIVNRNGGGSSAFSDTSSDISDATTSVPSASSVSGVAATVVAIAEGITEQDINQVEMFYRSHKTDVRVCRSLANLYVSSSKNKDAKITTSAEGSPSKTPTSDEANSDAPKASDISKDDWEFAKTGIPVLILDTGEHVRSRRLSIVLAEKGTGFTLWQDVVNHLTRYSTPHTNFHTLSLSTDSSRLVGLSFDEGDAATEFAQAVTSLTSNPDDDLLNLSKKKKGKKKEKKPKQKYKAPKKIDISQPCCFVHVTKLERPDFLGKSPVLFPPPPSGAELAQDRKMARAMSESSGISECSTTPSEN